jgi:hypothetical protein
MHLAFAHSQAERRLASAQMLNFRSNGGVSSIFLRTQYQFAHASRRMFFRGVIFVHTFPRN